MSFCHNICVLQGCVLAPVLFVVAIDWILNHLAPDVGITIGQHHFTDLTYADDAAIFTYDVTQAASTLQSFNTIAASLDLRISWAKTKLQNVGAGNPPTTLSLDGAPVEGVEEFIYLGSKQSSGILWSCDAEQQDTESEVFRRLLH